MEPLTLAATAIAATVMTKFWEKTGEKLGERVFSESENFLKTLGQKAPETSTAIAKVPEAPLDYGQAVIDVEALMLQDSDVAESAKAIAAAVAESPNVKLTALIQEILAQLQAKQNASTPQGKLADKIGNVALDGGTVSIQTQNL